MLADLPVSVNDIQNAILELATTINLEEQQKMTTMGCSSLRPLDSRLDAAASSGPDESTIASIAVDGPDDGDSRRSRPTKY